MTSSICGSRVMLREQKDSTNHRVHMRYVPFIKLPKPLLCGIWILEITFITFED